MQNMSDGQLVEKYISNKSQEAFTLLVKRHGGMVYSTCSRLLNNPIDAEDASQTVFLLLAKKAETLHKRDAVATWLFKTTHMVCMNFQQAFKRREKHEKEAIIMRHSELKKREIYNEKQNTGWNEIQTELDTVLMALPKKYRKTLLLAYLENRSHKEIAIELGVAESTVSTHVSRGLEMLRRKLSGKGVVMTTALLGSLLIENSLMAAPAPLIAKLAAIGTLSVPALTTTAATTGISSTSITLMETIMKTMFWVKVKITATVITTVVAVSISTPIVMNSIVAEEKKDTNQEQVTPAKPPVKQVENKEITKPVKSQKMIKVTPRTWNAWTVFNKFEEPDPKVVMIRKRNSLVIPSKLRFKPVKADELIEAVAKFNNLKVAWHKNKTIAVLYRGALDKAVKDLRKELASNDEKIRANAAWKAGWLEDPRVIDALAQVANDKSPDVVRYAVKSLSRLGFASAVVAGGDKMLPFLQRALKDYDVSVRKDAVLALGDIGGEKVVELLEEALNDRKPFVRGFVISVLEDMDGEKKFKLIKKALEDKNGYVRGKAVYALGSVTGDEAFELIKKNLKDRDLNVRRSAVFALVKVNRDEAFELAKNALNDEARFVRLGAISALGQIGGEKTIGILENFLDDKDKAVRSCVVGALGNISEKKALELIEKALDDKDAFVRIDAVSALLNIGGENSFELIEKVLDDKDANVRSRVISALGQIGGEKAFTLITKVLEDKDLFVKGRAISALGQIGGEKAFVLIEEALKDKNRNIKLSAVSALKQIGGEKASALIEKALEDEDVSVRRSAVSALTQIGGEKAFALIEKALEDKDVNVRHTAASALCQIGGEKAFALIEKAFEDKDDYMRSIAASALGQIGGEKALALIEKALKDKNRNIRLSAVSALKKIDGEKAFALIEKAFEDEDDNVRGSAISALGQVGGEKAFTLIEKAFEDEDENVRRSAVSALGQIDEEKALAHLEKALGDEKVSVRRSAIYALTQIDGEKTFVLIEKALEDEDVKVRRSAVFALGQIGGEKAFALIEKAFEDEDEKIRSSAVSALAQIGGKKTRDTLVKQLIKSQDETIRSRIMKLLKSKHPYDPLVAEVLKNLPKLDKKLTLTQAKEQLAKSGKVTIEQTDTINKNQTWFGVEKNFVAFFDEETGKLTTFTKAIADATDDKLTPTCILNLKNDIWVGTDKGLFCITRKDNSITQYAVNNEIIECKVLKLTENEGAITVETNKGTFRYHYKPKKWRK